MDVLLGCLTQQAMSYALRSGVSLATTYTIKTCSELLRQTPSSQEREEIARLQSRLETKSQIISPAMELIELITARGHTSLESAVTLTKDIKRAMQDLGRRLQAAVEQQDLVERGSKRAKPSDETVKILKRIIQDMKNLIVKIDDAVPLVNLAITTSGVNMSSKLATTISPSRLLQASTFVTAADTAYAIAGERGQVGPTFLVSLYMLFAGHASRAVDEAGIRETTWKEVLHKAHVKLVRGRSMDTRTTFAYQLVLIEDLDDGRVHTYEEDEPQPGPYEDIELVGIREVIPIEEVAKLFYADTGKILNIDADGEDNSPVLLLKRDTAACRPHVDDSNPGWQLPRDLDPEWLAMQVYTEDNDSVGDEDPSRSSLGSAFAALSFLAPASSPAPLRTLPAQSKVQTSLSLLEMLIKLAALQQFRQESHLSIEDEMLNFFLEESATAGAGADKARRQKIRRQAVQRVGFDPYDESPVKRRGETYIRDQGPGPAIDWESRQRTTTPELASTSSASSASTGVKEGEGCRSNSGS